VREARGKIQHWIRWAGFGGNRLKFYPGQ